MAMELASRFRCAAARFAASDQELAGRSDRGAFALAPLSLYDLRVRSGASELNVDWVERPIICLQFA